MSKSARPGPRPHDAVTSDHVDRPRTFERKSDRQALARLCGMRRQSVRTGGAGQAAAVFVSAGPTRPPAGRTAPLTLGAGPPCPASDTADAGSTSESCRSGRATSSRPARPSRPSAGSSPRQSAPPERRRARARYWSPPPAQKRSEMRAVDPFDRKSVREQGVPTQVSNVTSVRPGASRGMVRIACSPARRTVETTQSNGAGAAETRLSKLHHRNATRRWRPRTKRANPNPLPTWQNALARLRQ